MYVCMYVERIDLVDDVKSFLTIDSLMNETRSDAFRSLYLTKIDRCLSTV